MNKTMLTESLQQPEPVQSSEFERARGRLERAVFAQDWGTWTMALQEYRKTVRPDRFSPDERFILGELMSDVQRTRQALCPVSIFEDTDL